MAATLLGATVPQAKDGRHKQKRDEAKCETPFCVAQSSLHPCIERQKNGDVRR